MPRSLLLFCLCACSGDDKTDGSCPVGAVDGATATVDGAAWTAAEVGWSVAGESIHLISTSEGEGWFSIVAQLTTAGEAVATAVDSGEFPIEVTLKTGLEGGFVTWYSADDVASATTQGGGGTLTLSGEDDSGLSGCVAFSAGADGAGVSLEDGQFTAAPQ